MTAVHKRATNKVSKIETRAGICNIKPDRAGVRVTCILGEARQRILVVTEVLGKGRRVEDLGNLIHCEGDQLARLLITFGRQPIVREVTDLETGF